jgi:hypothetical protein
VYVYPGIANRTIEQVKTLYRLGVQSITEPFKKPLISLKDPRVLFESRLTESTQAFDNLGRELTAGSIGVRGDTAFDRKSSRST